MQRRTMLAASAALAATGLGGGSAATEHPEVGRFKAVYLIRRRPDIDHAEFRRRQTEDHYPLVEALPGLRRYRLDFFPPIDGADQPFDAIATVWFDDKAAHDAALASSAGQAAMTDLPNMNDMEAMRALFGETAIARDDFPD